jgi:hypothetical protein
MQFLIEQDLRQARAVAQINEDQLAQIAAAMDPAHQQGALSGVRSTQFPAGMCAAKVA